MALVGPGALQQSQVDVKPQLEGASQYEYITIYNPLDDDFAIVVAQDRPVNLPFEIRKDGNTSTITNTEQDVRATYGLPLKNPDHTALSHISNQTIIKSKSTINLKGDEAQVAVRQLVNYIIQKEGKSRLLADAHIRAEVEGRIIRHRGTVQDLMDGNINTPQQQATMAVNQSNEEQAFPTLKEEVQNGPEKRSPGRPRKES